MIFGLSFWEVRKNEGLRNQDSTVCIFTSVNFNQSIFIAFTLAQNTCKELQQ